MPNLSYSPKRAMLDMEGMGCHTSTSSLITKHSALIMFCLAVSTTIAVSDLIRTVLRKARQQLKALFIPISVVLEALPLLPIAVGFAPGSQSPSYAWAVAVLLVASVVVAYESEPVRADGSQKTDGRGLDGSGRFLRADPMKVWGRIPDLYVAWNIIAAANATPPYTFEGGFGRVPCCPGSFYPTPEQLVKPAGKGRIRYVANGRWVDAPLCLPMPDPSPDYVFSPDNDKCLDIPQCTCDREWEFVFGITNAMVDNVRAARERDRMAVRRELAEELAVMGITVPSANNVSSLVEWRKPRK